MSKKRSSTPGKLSEAGERIALNARSEGTDLWQAVDAKRFRRYALKGVPGLRSLQRRGSARGPYSVLSQACPKTDN